MLPLGTWTFQVSNLLQVGLLPYPCDKLHIATRALLHYSPTREYSLDSGFRPDILLALGLLRLSRNCFGYHMSVSFPFFMVV